jgi:hypothetical protein
VANRVEVQDPGFGANDVPRGVRDGDLDPELTGPFADRFPWSDDAILSGAIGVPAMLAYFRAVYAPRSRSPAIDTGDPRDGAGADIGAIGAGAPNDGDRFGAIPGSPSLAPAPHRASDGPFVLRCSTRAPGTFDRAERASVAARILAAWLALVGLCLARLQFLPPLSKPRAPAVKPHPHRR